MLSADAFSAFEEVGLEDKSAVKETGRRFRDTVQALGGGRAPADVFKVLSRTGLAALSANGLPENALTSSRCRKQ